MTIQEYNQKTREELKRLCPNLIEEDWKEIEAILEQTTERQMVASTPTEFAEGLLL